MKLAFVIPNLAKGGAERVVATLSRELSKYHEVHIILFDDKIEYQIAGKVVVLKLPPQKGVLRKASNLLRRGFQLRKVFQLNDYDKIFTFIESATMPAALSGYRIVSSIRTNPGRYSKLLRFIFWFIYNFPNIKRVVVPSKELGRIVSKMLINNKIDIIHNPLDFQEIKSLQNEQIDLTKPFILSVGRLEKVKRFDFLIQAYAKSRLKEHLDLVIIGTGSELQNLQRQIQELNLQTKVHLLGKKENVYAYMHRALFYVLSSEYEGFPNTLIEALACGRAVVATDCPTGPKEIVQSGINGILVPNRDEKSLSEAMERLFFQPRLRESMERNAAKSVAEFDVEKTAQKWVKI